MNRPLRSLGLATTLAACATTLLACSSEGPPAPDTGWAGQFLDSPVERPDFTLADTDGNPFDFQSQTDGQLTLLFIGYTNCPDVCPVHFANLAAVLDRQPYDVKSAVRVVFITADPARDTSERLEQWLDALHPDFVGLRGDRNQVNLIEDQLRVPRSSLGEDDGTGNYTVAHAAQIFAFGKDGPARLAYPFGTRQADWVRDLPRLAKGVLPADG